MLASSIITFTKTTGIRKSQSPGALPNRDICLCLIPAANCLLTARKETLMRKATMLKMCFSKLLYKQCGECRLLKPHVLELERQSLDASGRRRNPVGDLAGFGHGMH